jgi:uncharacterized protein (DUF433 family)
MSELIKRITIDPAICNGSPIIRGQRITVQTVLEFLFSGTTEKELLHQFPILEAKDIEACKEFALLMMKNKYSIKEIAA